MALSKQERRLRIKRRIRKKISGTEAIPRFNVFRSNKEIYVQVIDDVQGKTLVSVSSRMKEIAEKSSKVTKIEQAKLVGTLAAQKCKDSGIETVNFDRNGYLYHGRIKALADACREAGLKL